jgi:enoyl-[acyl-carrier protein] reductase II
MHRSSQFQEGLHPRSARDAIPPSDRPAPPGHPVRALKNREMEGFSAKQIEVAKLLDRSQVEMARPSSRSSITGPAPSAAP